MSDDIVARLRAWIPCYRADTDVAVDIANAADEIERLRKERDEARRSYCRAFVDIFPNPKYEELDLEDAAIEVAKEFGWECFKQAGR